MKASAIEVHDMLSVFSVDEVEKRISEVPGVQSVTVNFAAGNATVRYDETQLEATDIKSAVRQRGFDPTPPDTPAAPAAAGTAAPDKAAAPATPEPPANEPLAASAASEHDAKKETAVPSKD